jgi:PmbA protein
MSDRELEALTDLGAQLVERARSRGADVAEAVARSGWELSVKVRLGETEMVEEAGTRSVALRVLRGGRAAITSTSDLSADGLARCVDDALMLVELSEADPFAGPAPTELLCSAPHPELDLFDPALASVDAGQAIAWAREAEAAALGSDARLTLSEGATFSRTAGASAMVLSSGFSAAQRGSYASLVVTPVAEDEGGKRRRGYYWTAERHLAELEDREAVGREAARRTLAKLGARKLDTGEMPVIFDPDVARSLIGTLAGCVTGGAVWRKASYLVGRVDTEVASPLVTLVDDPLRPRAPGSRAWDGEGLRSRRNVVVERGILKTYLLDCYSARKLSLASTASAARSGGSVGASTSNFILEPGNETREALIGRTARGLYVTEMMGFGFNALTGDYSRGAAGFLIENGELGHPVGEITVSGNLDTMLKQIDGVANDLDLRTATAAPTLRVARMTVAGN